MDCKKIDMSYIDSEDNLRPDFLHCKTIKKSRKAHKCSECLREIKPGESYEYAAGKWLDKIRKYKTCSDCIIARKVFFHDDFYLFGQIWEDIFYGFRNCMPETCLAKLTKYHRDRICKKITEEWEEEERWLGI